jgi:orotidine-5'-phosphate decarboxylase
MSHALSAVDRIIVPLDVPTVEAAIALVDRLPQVSFWKVGLELFVSSGAIVLTEQTASKEKFPRFIDIFHGFYPD